MAMGKYSRVDGRKSSSCSSTLTVVAVVSLCLVGAWMLMSSSFGSIRSSGFSSQVPKEEVVKTVPRTVSKQFEDSSGDVPEDARKEESRVVSKENADSGENNVDKTKATENSEDQEEARNTGEGNQGSNHSKDSSDEVAGSQQETRFDDQNGIQNGDDGGKTGTESDLANNSVQKEAEDASGESSSKSAGGEASETEENATSSSTIGNKEDQALKEVLPAAGQSETLNEPKAQNSGWSTQAVESQNEKNLQQSSTSMDQSGYHWKVCNVTAGPDYIPCLDNWAAIRKLPSTKHYEHRERHCPEQAPTCLVPLPEGYKRSVKWPKSRDKIWYNNVPHTKLAEVKGHQNWVKVSGDYLTFPGGGTQFKNGALHYIDFIQNSVPEIAWGKRTHVILDVGCGVASFGGFLFERDVLAMSFAPKDEHEAQVQFALERGIPAVLNVMGTIRLPYPGSVFDLVHCARCRVPWHIEGGKLLLELNRVLRPGGFFVWSATPVYQKLPEDVGIWKEMSKLTKSMCWELVAIRKDKINNVGAAIYRKPVSNECYDARPRNFPPLCEESDDPNAAWNIPLQACMHRVPVDTSVRGSVWPEQWPKRVDKIPYWLNSQAGVYGKDAPEDFGADTKRWNKVVSESYLNGMGIDWSHVRNVMDMRAVYGGFAAALKDLKVWVMNVVPIDSPDTLPIIYERGLFGIYHDWCESFNTYPRTYDLLHADHLFSSIKKRCNLIGVISEVDRILRPKGILILRDDDETIGEVEKIAISLKWDVRMMFSKNNKGVLCVQKTLWRPAEAETIKSAVV